MTYVIRPDHRAAFKRCRRAWDLGSSARGNYEPPAGSPVVDIDAALRRALAVYYFPGMWEWDRAIVRPIAVDGFTQSLDEQRSARQSAGAPKGEPAGHWHEQLRQGSELLDHYFGWAPTEDDFVPVRVETDFSVRIPDPAHPGRDLTTPSGEPVHYEGRIDMLVVDPNDNYWIVEHRMVPGEWADLHELLLEERTTSYCWAWELFYLGMEITGVIYNELSTGAPSGRGLPEPSGPPEDPLADRPGHRRMYVRGGPDPGPAVSQKGSGLVRRTRVRRTRTELGLLRDQMANEALDMVDPGARIYPNPSLSNCGPCRYRNPCVALSRGADIEEALAGYRKRSPEAIEEGRLGGVTWSMGRGAAPPKFGRSDNR